MNIINRIEISYFRSLYKIDLREVSDLNIFSGSNDAGKSNVLKSLNLFFNGFTDWSKKIDFYSDINKTRLKEVRSESVKGKQIIWIAITFDTPESYNGSLPNTVRVKKKWDRYDDERMDTNIDTKAKHGLLPSSESVANRFLSRFLNKIEFEYIPAVRDEEFRSHLLKRLQNYILRNQEDGDSLAKTVSDLTDHIDPRINRLRRDFERITGIESSISPPDDITSLFQAFNVSTRHRDDHHVPLEQRGDGIQSQYLLSVLRHICSGDNKYHIWAFEEPENSLEYRRVKNLASDLKEDCDESQIFITTHSPALINIDGENTNLIRVHKDDKNTQLSSVLEGELEKDIGIEKIKSDTYEDYKSKVEKIENLENKIGRIEASNKNEIITEGKTDAQILQLAFNEYNDSDLDLKFRAVDPIPDDKDQSAGGAHTLFMFIETVDPSDECKKVAIFDNDEEGRKKYNNLSENFEKIDGDIEAKKHLNEKAYAMLLPKPSFRQEDEGVNIEKMFTDEVMRTKTPEGRGLVFDTTELDGIKLSNGEFLKAEKLNLDQGDLEDIPELNDLVGKEENIIDGKDVFASEVVPNLPSDEFQVFEPLFDVISEVVNDNL